MRRPDHRFNVWCNITAMPPTFKTCEADLDAGTDSEACLLAAAAAAPTAFTCYLRQAGADVGPMQIISNSPATKCCCRCHSNCTAS